MLQFSLAPQLWKTSFIILAYWCTLMLASLHLTDGGIPSAVLLPAIVAVGLPLFLLHGVSLWRLTSAAPSDLAYRDDLTGLGNRQAFIFEAKSLVKHARVGSRALVLVDIDGLRALNDECGHQAGDELLVAVADRLAAENVYVYRIGGDEFAIMIDRMEGEAVTSVLQLLEPFSLTLDTCGHEHRVCFTHGYASTARNETFESLFRRADTCLIELKRQLYASGGRTDRRGARDELALPVAVGQSLAVRPASDPAISSLEDRRRNRSPQSVI